MQVKIICSQGRVGDKTDATLRGAKLTADTLGRKFKRKISYIGKFSPCKNDQWKDSLPEAAPTLALLQGELQQCLEQDNTPILALNTCSASLATLPIAAAKYPDMKLLWIDAHGDFNTPHTTSTGYLGGMALAGACGLWDSGYGHGIRPEQVILIGAHDIDEAELLSLKQHSVRNIIPEKVNPENVIKNIEGSKVWIHIDWDVLDPGQINADYKVKGGLPLSTLIDTLKAIPASQVLGLEIAEFSPDENRPEQNEKDLINICDVVDALFLT
ncbi:arginase family protein [Erwinia tasmaniensis]|uniref:Arginase n=1 Tax=Erwinia tasmaniensis (strain DSM 17950 / CFBP 7177 / CIP 109463 / NCPPB 4357 / Et1/99) TaxID=465817 RepID=B2VFW6_ERWT9|nr:arginase family protein [Erwinia tasmaniensis]CAO97798.1 Arginase [Erwinia tasmaniensis Et1/99]